MDSQSHPTNNLSATIVNMKRVVVIGSPGAGKTTFVRKLADKTKLPLIHLDYYYHDTNKDYYHSKEAWIARVQKLMAGDSWIIDGNYSSTIPERFKMADTIIYIDIPRRVALYRVLKRRIQYRSKLREDMPADWKEKANWEFLKYVWGYNKAYRPMIADELEKHKEKMVYILKNSKQVKNFLKGL